MVTPSVVAHPQIWLGSMGTDRMVCFVSVPSSNEEPSVDPPSPLSAKRRVLSRSALQSHQPVARPVAMGLSRYGAAEASGGVGTDTELLILSVWPIVKWLSNSWL